MVNSEMILDEIVIRYLDEPLAVAWFYALAPTVETVLRIGFSNDAEYWNVDPYSGTFSIDLPYGELSGKIDFSGFQMRGFFNRKFHASPDDYRLLNKILKDFGMNVPFKERDVKRFRLQVTRAMERKFDKYGDVDYVEFFGKRELDDLNLPDETVGYVLAWYRTPKGDKLQKAGLPPKQRYAEIITHSVIVNRKHRGATLIIEGSDESDQIRYKGTGITPMYIDVKSLVKQIDDKIHIVELEDGTKRFV